MAVPLAKKLDDVELSEEDLNRAIKNTLAKKHNINNVYELVHWFLDGRRDLLMDLSAAAKELGVAVEFVYATVGTAHFRRVLFNELGRSTFNVNTLARGLDLLARDFTDRKVSPAHRIAIYRLIQELFDATPVAKHKHEVNVRHAPQIVFRIEGSPSDLLPDEDPTPRVVAGQHDLHDALGDGDGGEPGEDAIEVHYEPQAS